MRDGTEHQTADLVRERNRSLDAELRDAVAHFHPSHLTLDPGDGEWTLAQNLAHLGEFPRFFAKDVQAQIHETEPEVGRTHEHPERIAAIDGAYDHSMEDLQQRMEDALIELAGALEELRDEHLSKVARNRKYGPEPMTAFLDRYILGHKEGHVRQLHELHERLVRLGSEAVPDEASGGDPALVVGGDNSELLAFYEDLAANELEALWRITKKIMPFEPRSKVAPWRWSYRSLRALAARAGELVPITRGGDRRVLACINPTIRDRFGATATLWAAIQYLGPRESAPGHRHSPSALRFVVEGSGAWTTVNGDRCHMSAGDLVLTPAWTWHNHENESDEPMSWFDGLDLPLVNYLDATFFEFYPPGARRQTPDDMQPDLDTHGARRAFGHTGLLPARVPPVVAGSGSHPLPEGTEPGRASPLLTYPWEQTEQALEARREDEGDPFDDVLLRYVDPETGGPVLPTLDATIQLLREDRHGPAAHRHVHSTVYQVFRGAGRTVIDGTAFEWEQGDIIAVPPWAAHEHHARDGDAILFAITDEPVIRGLGLQRVLGLESPQEVTGEFDPSSAPAR